MHHPEKTASLVSKVQAQSAAVLAFHELYASTRASKFEAKKAGKESLPPRLLHMGSKHYRCSNYGCKLTFNNMQQLLQHARVHKKPIQSMEGRQFHCSTVGCKEVLPSMQGLLAHLKTHYKPNRYFKCENCIQRFRSHRSLFKHLHVCYDVSARPSPQRVEKKKSNPALKGGLEASVKPLLLEGLPKLQSVIIHPEKQAVPPKLQSVIIHPEKEAVPPKLQSVLVHPQKEAVLPDKDTVNTATSTSATPRQPVSSLEDDLPDLQDDLPDLQDDLPDLQDNLQDSLSSLPVTSPVPQTFSLLETSLFGSSTLPRLSGEVHTTTSEPFLPYVPPFPYNFNQANVQHRVRPYLPNQSLPVSSAVWKKNQDYGAPLTPFHSKLTPDMENPIYSQL